MALVSERLEFLITANASQAVSEFNKVAKASDKSLDGVEKRWGNADAMLSFGAKAVAVAGVAAVGLKKMADAASNLNETINFSQQIFGDASDAVMEWSETTDKAMGLSQRAALDAAASLGIFGKRIDLSGQDLADFSTGLTQLAGDMASVKNTRVEDAVTAIAAAMRNEYEPIRKYGVVLNDVVLKARALALGIYDGTGQLTQQQKIVAAHAELYDQLSFAQGDFARTSGQLANQQRILSASFENLQANLGRALLPMFKTLVGGAESAVSAFNNLDPAIQDAVGQFAGFSTIALGVVGALSMLAGAVGKIRSNFTNAAGGLNKFGMAAKLSTAAIAGFAGVEIGIGVFNEITDAAGTAERALQSFVIASEKGPEDIVQAFAKMSEAEDDTGRLSHLWEDFGDELHIVGTEGTNDIEDVNRAFDKLLKTSPEQAQALVDAMKDMLAQLGPTAEGFDDTTKMVADYQQRIDLATGSQKVLTEATDLGAEHVEAEGEAVKEAEKAFDSLIDTLDDLSVAQQGMTERATAFGDAMEAQPLDDYAKSALGIREAQLEWVEAMKEGKPVLDAQKIITGQITAEQMTSTEALLNLGGSYQDYIQTLIDSGKSTDEVVGHVNALRESFYMTGHAAGATDEEIQGYLYTLGLTPEQVETYLKIAGDAEAKLKIQLYNDLLDDIPPDVKSEIAAYIAEGEYAKAAARMDALARDRHATVYASVDINEGNIKAQVQSAIALAGGTYAGPTVRMAPRAAGNTTITYNFPPGVNPSTIEKTTRRHTRRNGGYRSTR